MMTQYSEFARFLESVMEVTASLDSNEELERIQESLDPECFGNAVITYRCNEILLRFSKDRGDVLLDISNAQYDEWWPLDSVANVLGEDPPGLDLASIGASLTKLFERIKTSFAASEYQAFRKKLDAESKRRIEEFRTRWGQ